MTDKALALFGGAHVHLDDHLSRIGRRAFRIAYVHDHDPVRRDKLCKTLDARPLATPNDIQDTRDVAGVVTCSETCYHEADISVALNMGLPVFTEKPMAGSAAAAWRLANLAEKQGVALMTGYFMRTNTGFRNLKAALDADALGTVFQARMRFAHDGGFADWLDLDTWMTDPTLACYGGFADEAVHCLDMLMWLLGPVEFGQAITGNALGHGLDDHGAAVLRFSGGAVGVVEAGWTDTGMRLELSLEGTRGTAQVADGRLEIRQRDVEQPVLRADLDALDAGSGIEPFLDLLEDTPNEAAVSADAAAHVNQLLDDMGLNLG